MIFAVVCFAALAQLPHHDTYLAAARALEQGQHAVARTGFEKVAEAGGELAAYAEVRAAEAMVRTGKVQEGLARLEKATHGHGGQVRLARLLLGLLQAQHGQRAAAVPTLQAAFQLETIPWFIDAQMWDAAEALLASPELAHAGYGFHAAIVEKPGFTPKRNDAAKRLANSPAPEHALTAARGLFRAGLFPEAEKLILRAPGPMLEALERLKTPGVDAKAFLKENKANVWATLLVAHAVRLQYRAGAHDHAIGLARALVEVLPNERESGDCLWFLAQLLAKDPKNRAKAMGLYEELARNCPGHWRGANAVDLVVKDALDRGQLKEALALAERLWGLHPENRLRAESYYKLAMAQEKKGDREGALRSLHFAVNSGPGDYFAHRAWQRLGEWMPDFDAANSIPPITLDGKIPLLRPMTGLNKPLAPLPAEFQARPMVQRLHFFGFNGLEEGEWEAFEALSNIKGHADAPMWYRAVSEAGFLQTAFQFADLHAWGFEGGAKTVDRWRMEYPLAYWGIYTANATRDRVDPYLLLSLSRQESTFRASIVSRSGAKGVMQLMPATARWMGQTDPEISAEDVATLGSPRHCIKLGSRYIRQMLDKFGNNMIYASAAYNGGPGNVGKWRKQWPNATPDEFVDVIPFEETSGYVRRVLGNLLAYHSLYPAPDKAAALLAGAQ